MTSKTQLVERNLTRSRIEATRLVKHCPTHGDALDGGPVQFRCPDGHRVMAADLSNEFHAPIGGAA